MIRDLLVLALVVGASTSCFAQERPGQSYSDRELYMNKELAQEHPRFRALARDVKKDRLLKLKRSPIVQAKVLQLRKARALQARQYAMARTTREPFRATTAAEYDSGLLPGEEPLPTPGQPIVATPAPEAPPAKPTAANITDAEIAAVIGQNQTTGAVSNPMSSSFNWDIDSFAAWVHQANAVKLGLSVTALALDSNHTWRVNGDVADNLVGASLNWTGVPGIRLALGVGYGRLLGDTADAVEAKGHSKNTAYFKGSVRLW